MGNDPNKKPPAGASIVLPPRPKTTRPYQTRWSARIDRKPEASKYTTPDKVSETLMKGRRYDKQEERTPEQTRELAAEFKKAVQVAEGERKASYEDYEREKRGLDNRTRVMLSELRHLRMKHRFSMLGEQQVLTMTNKNGKRVGPLSTVNRTRADDVLSRRIATLRLDLDKTKYQKEKMTAHLSTMLTLYKDLVANFMKDFQNEQSKHKKMVMTNIESEVAVYQQKIRQACNVRRIFNTILESYRYEEAKYDMHVEMRLEDIFSTKSQVESLRVRNAKARRSNHTAKGMLDRLQKFVVEGGEERERILRSGKMQVATLQKDLAEVHYRMLRKDPAGLMDKKISATEAALEKQAAAERLAAKKESEARFHDYDARVRKFREEIGVSDIDHVVKQMQKNQRSKRMLNDLHEKLLKELESLKLEKTCLTKDLEKAMFQQTRKSTSIEGPGDQFMRLVETQRRKRYKCEKELRIMATLMDELKTGLNSIIGIVKDHEIIKYKLKVYGHNHLLGILSNLKIAMDVMIKFLGTVPIEVKMAAIENSTMLLPMEVSQHDLLEIREELSRKSRLSASIDVPRQAPASAGSEVMTRDQIKKASRRLYEGRIRKTKPGMAGKKGPGFIF